MHMDKLTVSSRVVHTPWRGREPLLLARGSIAGGFRTSGVIVCRSGRIGDDVKYPHAKANPEAHDRGYRRSLITSSGRAPVRDRARPVKTRPWSCPPPSTAARPSGRCGQQFPQQDKPCLRHAPVSLPVTSRPRDHPIACVQKVLLELGGYEPPQSLFSQFRSTFLFRSTAQEPSSHEKTGHRTLDR